MADDEEDSSSDEEFFDAVSELRTNSVGDGVAVSDGKQKLSTEESKSIVEDVKIVVVDEDKSDKEVVVKDEKNSNGDFDAIDNEGAKHKAKEVFQKKDAPVPPPRRKVPANNNDKNDGSQAEFVEPPDDVDNMTVTNLDTGVSCKIDDIEEVFPDEILSLDFFDKNNRHKDPDVAEVANEATATEPEHETFLSKLKNLVTSGRSSMRNPTSDNRVNVKVKHKKFQDLTDLRHVQSVLHHTGPIWTMEWNLNGHFLATGGQDSIVRVWVVSGSEHVSEMDKDAQQMSEEEAARLQMLSNFVKKVPAELGGREIILETPFRSYSGHKADVIDLAWSKGNFLLSASIDKTVKLWHVSRSKCLCTFQHKDFVTAVAFHPVEDKFFVSGSFDKKIRMWNIPDHCVVEWAQPANIITAAAFSPDGKRVVAGLYNGQCVFYNTHGLKYVTQVDARNRHGKYRKGKKVTGLQFTPDGKHVMVTTNDSRLRLYSMDDYSCITKYKGLTNSELQIRASFNANASQVVCGSENQQVYVWNVKNEGHDEDTRYTSESYESFRADTTTVTCTQFAPRSTIRLSAKSAFDEAAIRHMFVTAGYNGQIKFFENRGARKAV